MQRAGPRTTMAKYRFRLQKVMEARQCLEDQKKQDVAVAERVLDREKRRLLQLHAQGETCRREMLGQCSGPLDMQLEAMYRARFARLKKDIIRQGEAVEHSNQKVARERTALLECSKERKMLESLREKGLLECMRGWLKREQKETDDVGRDLFVRRANDAGSAHRRTR